MGAQWVQSKATQSYESYKSYKSYQAAGGGGQWVQRMYEATSQPGYRAAKRTVNL